MSFIHTPHAMDDAYEVPDSTDWLNTPLKDLSALENALHCQICKEFYDTPMITTCNHTFCSKCIRTSLSADGKCPACRATDQASKLRNNWAMQEVVSTFLTARPATLDVARKAQEHAESYARPGKRKRNVVLDSDDTVGAEDNGRTTRSKSRRIAASQDSQPETIDIDESENEGQRVESILVPQDGLVECPLGCGKRMKEEQVFGHLDKCEDEQKQAKRAKSRIPENESAASNSDAGARTRPQDRINELNYSMMKDGALSKKLRDIGIPHFGSKQLMINRHKEWVNIWNANCDSNQPRSRRDLLRDLDTWERTQGGKAPSANGLSTTVMRKDFDGNAYSKRHQDEFSRLIADAKRRKNIQQAAGLPQKDPAHPATSPEQEGAQGESGNSPFFASATSTNMVSHEKEDRSERKAGACSDPKPYENNTEAMTSIREKVDAVNHGEEITPIMNEGFKVPTTMLGQNDKNALPTSCPAKGSNYETKTGSTSMNHSTRTPEMPPQSSQRSPEKSSSPQVANLQRAPSRDEHIVHGKTGSPCDIQSHLDLETPEPAKRVPMFEVPAQQIGDVDGMTTGS